MIRRESKDDLAAAARVARTLVLQSVTSTAIEVTRHVASRDRVDGVRLNYKRTDKGTAVLSKDGDVVLAAIEFNLVVTTKVEPDDPLISIRLAFELEYRRVAKDVPIADSDLERFARINGVYNAWPYIRELVASSIMRLGYPALTLPSLVIAPKSGGPKPPSEPSSTKRSSRSKAE